MSTTPKVVKALRSDEAPIDKEGSGPGPEPVRLTARFLLR